VGVETDEAAVGKLVRTFKRSYNRLDGLVNCAGPSSLLSASLFSRSRFLPRPGINLPSPSAHELSLELWNQTMDVNVKGTFAFCKHFAAHAVSGLEAEDGDAPVGGFAIVVRSPLTCLPLSVTLLTKR
jgi:NAD(P)-dependent dehydrogenase (short-subunit alcohol dehydrogenase family)